MAIDIRVLIPVMHEIDFLLRLGYQIIISMFIPWRLGTKPETVKEDLVNVFSDDLPPCLFYAQYLADLNCLLTLTPPLTDTTTWVCTPQFNGLFTFTQM